MSPIEGTGVEAAATPQSTLLEGTGIEASATPQATVSGQPPQPPTSLTVVPGDGFVDVSWTPTADTTAYKVYRVGVAAPVATVSVPTTTFHHLTANDVPVAYQVASANSVGESQKSVTSATVTPTAPVQPPPPPTSVTVAAGDGFVDISWPPSLTATSYKVYKVGTVLAVATLAAPTTTFHHITPNGTPVSYQISAVNTVGESAKSVASAIVTPSIVAPPPVPPPPAAIAVVPGDGFVDVSWATAPGATSYKVYKVGTPTAVSTVTAPTTSFRHTTANGTAVSYQVSSVNATGESAKSVVSDTVTPAAVVILPAVPSAVTATPGNGFVIVLWSPSPTATSYKVYVVGNPVAVATIAATTTTYQHTTPNGVTVAYQVSAVNANGESAKSGQSPFVTPTATPVTVAIVPTRVTLDPIEIEPSRSQLDLTSWIGAEIDWGDAAIEAYMAEAERGQVPVSFRMPNRIITMPLLLLNAAGVPFTTIRARVQAKVALLQREGGTLKRTGALGDGYADVVNATLRLGGLGYMEALRQADLGATLTLECLPDWYGPEINLGTKTETVAPEIRIVLPTVKGNHPGRAHVTVTDLQGQSQRGLIWGWRSRHYSAATTNALVYAANALTPMDSSSLVTVPGSTSATVIRHSSLLRDWLPILNTNLVVGGSLTHEGSYRAWARMHSTSLRPPRARFVWDVGDLLAPSINAPMRLPATNAWFLVDLGAVRLDAAPVGTHRWRGIVQAAGEPGDSISVDRLWLFPTDEGYGTMQASSTPSEGITSYVAYDAFTTGTVLAGRIATTGGTWLSTGAAGDFVWNSGSISLDGVMMRSVGGTRFGILGAVDFPNASVTCSVWPADVSDVPDELGVVARWANASNYLALVITDQGQAVRIIQVVGGVPTTLASAAVSAITGPCALTLTARPTGEIVGVADVFDNPLVTLNATSVQVATGGILATGRPGFKDAAATLSSERWFGDLRVTVPINDAIVFAGRSASLRYDGVFRQNADGSGYGSVARLTDALPRIPPSGAEGRPMELMVKTSRGNLADAADPGADDLSVQVAYRPSWLFTPEA